MRRERRSAFELEGFGVALEGQVVLSRVDLALAPRGIQIVMGPAGAGKSTLLRTLAGANHGQPSLATWGEVRAVGPDGSRTEGLGEAARHIALVVQNTRFFVASVRENLASARADRASRTPAEQNAEIADLLFDLGLATLQARTDEEAVALPLAERRQLAIARAVATGAPFVFVDEPTAGMEESEAEDVLSLLRRLAERRSLLVVTHNQAHAKALDGELSLLAGGEIRERGPALQFFDAPETELGQRFARTGGCGIAEPATEIGADTSRSPDEGAAPAEKPGPSGFHWLRRRVIGGCPRPGLLGEVDRDLDALAALGIAHLVCLEERQPLGEADLAERGIRPLHSPIEDMRAPTTEQAESLVAFARERAARGEPVAVHCRAGLGRTGTVLACVLIAEGCSAPAALERIRAIRPGWVQSGEQLRFLEFFASSRGGAGDCAAVERPAADEPKP